MSKPEWLLANALRDLQADIAAAECEIYFKRQPSYDLLGTMRVNLKVAHNNIQHATPEQEAEWKVLWRKAEKLGVEL
jgi:hypothetical protein